MRRALSSVSRFAELLAAACVLATLLATHVAWGSGIDPSLVRRREQRIRRLGPIVKEVTFIGNETVEDEVLLEYMETAPGGLLSASHYQYRTLMRDLDNLERLYATLGFLDARVVLEDTSLSADSLRIRFLLGVYEGPRWVIDGVRFEGNHVLANSTLRRLTALDAGSPLLSRQLDQDWSNVLDAYARLSYLDATVDQDVTRDDIAHTASVAYSCTERHQAFIDSILVTGNARTRDFVITREIEAGPGELLDPDRIGESQALLYKTGLFHAVWVEPDRADTGLVNKDLVVGVRERPAGEIDLTVGYAVVDGFEGGLRVENRNLFGQAIRLRAEGEYGRASRMAQLSLADPWFVGLRVSGELSASYEWAEEESYTAESSGASFFLTKSLTPSLSIEGGYRYERTIVYDVTEELENTGESYTTDLILAATLDSRDDVLNPRRGVYASGSVDFASSRLGGTNDFLKTDLTLSSYKRWTHQRVLAGSFRIGWIGPLGSDVDVPPSELYLAGGAGSVRGFERHSLGPRGEGGDVVGGRALVVGRGEVRFPVAGSLTGAVFGDAGQVYDGFDAIRLSELAAGAGLGLRYETAFGLFRLDVAWPVTESGPGAWYAGIGQAF